MTGPCARWDPLVNGLERLEIKLEDVVCPQR